MAPFVFIPFLFYPWTALLCYDCISYEGSVSDSGSGPHGGKDCTSKSLTGTTGDGAGECLLSLCIFILDFDFDTWPLRFTLNLAIRDLVLTEVLGTQVKNVIWKDVTGMQIISSRKNCQTLQKFTLTRKVTQLQ